MSRVRVFKSEAELSRNRELQVNVVAREYQHRSEVKLILEKILLGLGLYGDWILTLERLVKSRGPARFKLKTGSLNGMKVVIKPAGQDSAGEFRLTTPSGLHPLDVYNRLRTYLASMTDAALAASDESDELDEPDAVVPVPPPAPVVAALPTPVAVTPPAIAATDTVLGQMVHLQQAVQAMQFNHEMRLAYSGELKTLTEQRDLLQLELQDVLAKIRTAEQNLAEVPAVDEAEYLATKQRWAQVEEGLKLLRTALG